MGNKGYSGACIRVTGASVIHLHAMFRGRFISNHAIVSGGAIFARATSNEYPPLCVFQIDSFFYL